MKEKKYEERIDLSQNQIKSRKCDTAESGSEMTSTRINAEGSPPPQFSQLFVVVVVSVAVAVLAKKERKEGNKQNPRRQKWGGETTNKVLGRDSQGPSYGKGDAGRKMKTGPGMS